MNKDASIRLNNTILSLEMDYLNVLFQFLRGCRIERSSRAELGLHLARLSSSSILFYAFYCISTKKSIPPKNTINFLALASTG